MKSIVGIVKMFRNPQEASGTLKNSEQERRNLRQFSELKPIQYRTTGPLQFSKMLISLELV